MSENNEVSSSVATDPPAVSKLTQAYVQISVPVCYDYLSVIGAAAREFCATLPLIIQEEKIELSAGQNGASSEHHRLGSAMLELPGSGATIVSGYSHFVYSVELILQEATSNVVRHGFGGKNLDEHLTVTLLVEELGPQRYALVMELEDSGPAFDPVAAPVEVPNPLEPKESGYGIYLLHKLLDRLHYSRRDDKNYLRMVKYLV
jgi:anti-sigma regulatory factor (Ser/Thr protein kinase)